MTIIKNKGLGRGNSVKQYAFTGNRLTAALTSSVMQSIKANRQKGEEEQDADINKDFFDSLKGLVFYRWEHGSNHKPPADKCCFNCAIGWPTKNGKPMEMFDYEKQVYDLLMQKNGDDK